MKSKKPLLFFSRLKARFLCWVLRRIKIWHTNNDGPGSGMDADARDAKMIGATLKIIRSCGCQACPSHDRVLAELTIVDVEYVRLRPTGRLTLMVKAPGFRMRELYPMRCLEKRKDYWVYDV